MQTNRSHRLWKVAQSPINLPIWSHGMRLTVAKLATKNGFFRVIVFSSCLLCKFYLLSLIPPPFVFFQMHHSRPLFLYFCLFNTVYLKSRWFITLPMTGFEPWILCVGSDRSIHWATCRVFSAQKSINQRSKGRQNIHEKMIVVKANKLC